jgi:hypothetical protein
VLGVVLRHKAAHAAGTLLMWTLQRPQLINMDHAQGIPSVRTLAGLLYRSSECVVFLAESFVKADSASSSNSIGTYAAAMTQQLEQSGARHTCMHWAAAAVPCSAVLPCLSVAALNVKLMPSKCSTAGYIAQVPSIIFSQWLQHLTAAHPAQLCAHAGCEVTCVLKLAAWLYRHCVLPCHAGVLPGLAVVLQDVIRLTTQQQQQQPDWWLYKRILSVLGATPTMWDAATRACPAMSRITIPAALPLLQQLQRCGQLLPAATATPPSHSSSSSSNSSSRGTGGDVGPHQELMRAQHNMLRFLAVLANYVNAQQAATGVDPQMPACQLLRDPAVSELLLQLLAAHTAILHTDHVAHRQQQRDAAAGSSSSSSSGHSQQRPAQGAKQQQRADLLYIPAYHQHPDMLQLLPGGQVYLEAARKQQQIGTDTQLQLLAKILPEVRALQGMVIASLGYTLDAQHGGQAVDVTAPVLSAAAVRLVLQLQLLAASFVQRRRATKQQQQQQQQQDAEMLEDVEVLLVRNNYLLQMQIRAVLQCTGSSSLQPEVLQQAGLQLLQALAAPLQQLQLCSPHDQLLGLVSERANAGDRINEQLLALQAAAAGMLELTPSTTGNYCCCCCCCEWLGSGQC